MANSHEVMELTVGVIAAGVLGVFLFPVAFEIINQSAMTDMNSGAGTMWEMVPRFMILSVFIGFSALIYRAGK